MPATPPARRRTSAPRRAGVQPGAAMAITERQILDALRGGARPGQGRRYRRARHGVGLVVRDGNVGFAIEVEPERGARLEPLRKAAEQAVEALPGVLSVTAVLTAETAPGPRAAAAAADARGARRRRRPAPPAPAPAKPRWRRACARSSPSPRARAGSASRPIAANLALGADGERAQRSACSTPTSTAPRCRACSGSPASRRSPDGKTLRPMENYGLKMHVDGLSGRPRTRR